MSVDPIWHLVEGDGPLIAAAIHDGHALRADVAAHMALSEADRLREEDPFTARWTGVASTRVIGLNSRFQVDLNRPREAAVYRTPADAWGLNVWRDPAGPPADVVAHSLAEYDAFYTAMHDLIAAKIAAHGAVVVFDLHSYNHRRDGPDAPPADPAANPEINIGTDTGLDRAIWGRLIDGFMADLHTYNYAGRSLDVRENVRFRGGAFARWIHATFGSSACALAIECKKHFMDEWTGQPDDAAIGALGAALAAAVPGVLTALDAR